MTAVLAFVLGGGVGYLAGLRFKHRRFLIQRTRANDLNLRMDAYRLGDTRTDLDEVGGLSPDRKVEQYQQTDTETLGPTAQPILAGDGLGPVARVFLPDPHPLDDDTGQGTHAHLRTGTYGDSASRYRL